MTKYIYEDIDLSSLIKAREQFEYFGKNCSDQINISMEEQQKRAGAIQAFAFCYELAWKSMRKILASKKLIVISPKDIFRQAAKNQLIDNPEDWIEFTDLRNMTVHTYNQDYAVQVVESFERFSQAFQQLIEKDFVILCQPHV